MQVIEHRLYFDAKIAGVALLKGLFEPLERFILISQTLINSRY
jgi:hypothetical protein